MLRTFNHCLSRTKFPARWKTARLVLLHKGPGQPTQEPSSYRPLCMLNFTAKLLERLLLTRLNRHLDLTGPKSENQYGFRQGRSTEDAIDRVICTAHGAALGAVQHRDLCVVVSLDVRNAFNTAPWRPALSITVQTWPNTAHKNSTIPHRFIKRYILIPHTTNGMIPHKFIKYKNLNS